MIATAPGHQALRLTTLDFENDMSWRDAFDRFARIWTWIGAYANQDRQYGVTRKARSSLVTNAESNRARRAHSEAQRIALGGAPHPVFTDCRNCGTCDHSQYKCPCGCHSRKVGP